MKQFLNDQKITYNLLSYTGYKSLILFSLLTESPKSYQEICDYFKNHKHLREKVSIDTVRVYINSFKAIGCEVKRIKGEDKISRYYIQSHPFQLHIPPEQIASIVKVYRTLVKNIEIKELLALENFLEKICEYIDNDELLNSIYKYSLLKDINKKTLAELLDCCDRKNQIVITYKSPNTGSKEIEIIADKIEANNNKVYLYGIGLEYNQYGSFLVSRIEKINEIKLTQTIPNIETLEVIYEIKESDITNLDNNEQIIGTLDDKSVVEVKTSNKFMLRQKLLELGPKAKILEPESFKQEFISYLKDMKAGYYCG